MLSRGRQVGIFDGDDRWVGKGVTVLPFVCLSIHSSGADSGVGRGGGRDSCERGFQWYFYRAFNQWFLTYQNNEPWILDSIILDRRAFLFLVYHDGFVKSGIIIYWTYFVFGSFFFFFFF